MSHMYDPRLPRGLSRESAFVIPPPSTTPSHLPYAMVPVPAVLDPATLGEVGDLGPVLAASPLEFNI
jgi:hypothetical protein